MAANKKSGVQTVKGKRIVMEREVAAKPHSTTDLEATVTIDRRGNGGRRSTSDRRARNLPVAVEHRTLQRRVKVNRRRQIDPTTCERNYTPEEIEFMIAMDEYNRRNGRMFPTCSEVLEVVQSLGYEKRPKTADIALPAIDLPVAAGSTATVA